MGKFTSVFDPDGWPPVFEPLGNETGIYGVDMWRCRIPDDSGILLPHISVCTISDAEVSERMAAGEHCDVLIHDHSTYFWFEDRDGYVQAYRSARMTSKGGRLANIAARMLVDVDSVDGAPVSMVIDASPHHVAEGVS